LRAGAPGAVTAGAGAPASAAASSITQSAAIFTPPA